MLFAIGLSAPAYCLVGSESSETQEGAAGRMPSTIASGQKSMFGIDQAPPAGVCFHSLISLIPHRHATRCLTGQLPCWMYACMHTAVDEGFRLQGSMRGSWRGRDAGSADKVTALHAAASWLIVGRASGAVQSYALPSLQYTGLGYGLFLADTVKGSYTLRQISFQ